jgi:hypothetical protein
MPGRLHFIELLVLLAVSVGIASCAHEVYVTEAKCISIGCPTLTRARMVRAAEQESIFILNICQNREYFRPVHLEPLFSRCENIVTFSVLRIGGFRTSRHSHWLRNYFLSHIHWGKIAVPFLRQERASQSEYFNSNDGVESGHSPFVYVLDADLYRLSDFITVATRGTNRDIRTLRYSQSYAGFTPLRRCRYEEQASYENLPMVRRPSFDCWEYPKTIGFGAMIFGWLLGIVGIAHFIHARDARTLLLSLFTIIVAFVVASGGYVLALS